MYTVYRYYCLEFSLALPMLHSTRSNNSACYSPNVYYLCILFMYILFMYIIYVNIIYVYYFIARLSRLMEYKFYFLS